MSIMRRLLLWASENQWMRSHVPEMGIARRAVRRFMPGEDLESALRAAQEFEEQGIPTVLTNLGENVTDLDEATEVTEHYSRALDEVADGGFDAEISIKLTHLGLDVEKDAAYRNTVRLAERAATRNSFLWVDMEGSAYTDVTLDLVERALDVRPNVGVCVQAYLYRTEADVERMLEAGAGIRLVKGAYDEPASIAFPRKKDVDANFFELSRQLLASVDGRRAPLAFATHDGELVDRICEEAECRDVERDRFEFQMLYGIGRDLQRKLNEDGYTIRVLISYGKGWFPWYMRRLAERPANVFFALRQALSR